MPRKLSSEWVSSSKLCEVFGISTKLLIRLRADTTLREGTHWVNISPTAARPTYRYHFKRVEKALGVKGDRPAATASDTSALAHPQ